MYVPSQYIVLHFRLVISPSDGITWGDPRAVNEVYLGGRMTRPTNWSIISRDSQNSTRTDLRSTVQWPLSTKQSSRPDAVCCVPAGFFGYEKRDSSWGSSWELRKTWAVWCFPISNFHDSVQMNLHVFDRHLGNGVKHAIDTLRVGVVSISNICCNRLHGSLLEVMRTGVYSASAMISQALARVNPSLTGEVAEFDFWIVSDLAILDCPTRTSPAFGEASHATEIGKCKLVHKNI